MHCGHFGKFGRLWFFHSLWRNPQWIPCRDMWWYLSRLLPETDGIKVALVWLRLGAGLLFSFCGVCWGAWEGGGCCLCLWGMGGRWGVWWGIMDICGNMCMQYLVCIDHFYFETPCNVHRVLCFHRGFWVSCFVCRVWLLSWAKKRKKLLVTGVVPLVLHL